MGPVEEDAPTKPWVHVTPPPVRQSPKPAESETPAFRKRPPWEPESLDLTALVDVTLFLMFFFMVTSSYNMQKSLDLPKPAPDDQTAQQAPTLDDLRDDNIVLEVLADDSVLMNDRTVPVAELPDLLRAEMRQTGLNEVILRASPQAHHEAVVSAYDAANQVGAQRIRLAKLADEADADAASSP
jgi:biopolymer transport protein ExbD